MWLGCDDAWRDRLVADCLRCLPSVGFVSFEFLFFFFFFLSLIFFPLRPWTGAVVIIPVIFVVLFPLNW